MKKLLISVSLIFLSLNINAAISQSGITNLKQLNGNQINELISGNKLTGFMSVDGNQGPMYTSYFTNGTYATVFNSHVYRGDWKVINSNKNFCTKPVSSNNWSCYNWFTGIKDGGQYAYIKRYGDIIVQFHKVEIANEELKVKSSSKESDKKYAETEKEKVVTNNDTNTNSYFVRRIGGYEDDGWIINNFKRTADGTRCISKSYAESIGFQENNQIVYQDDTYTLVCPFEDFNIGAERFWKCRSCWDTYLAYLGLPEDRETEVLLNVYFNYLIFRGYNEKSKWLVSNSKLKKIKDYSSSIQNFYEENSNFSTDDVWNIAEKIYIWKYDFFGKINDNDFSYVNGRVEQHINDLFEWSIEFGLTGYSTNNDL